MSNNDEAIAVLEDVYAAIALLQSVLDRFPARPTTVEEHKVLLQLDAQMDALVDALLDLGNTLTPPVEVRTLQLSRSETPAQSVSLPVAE